VDGWTDYRTARPAKFDRTAVPPLPSSSTVRLTPDESGALLEAALVCTENPYLSEQREDFIRTARVAGKICFSTATRQAAQEILDRGFGALLLEDLPVDPVLPPTPSAGGALDPHYKSTFVSEFVSVALGVLVDAEIFNFRQEGRGSAPLFDNVVPINSLRLQRGAGGYANNFPFHCDSTWHRMRSDYLALVGIRPDPNALTMACSVVDIADTDLIDGMPLESFRLKPPDLYTQMEAQGIPLGAPHYRLMNPIEIDATAMNVNFNGTDCRGPVATEWLSHFEDVVEEKAVGCILSRGNGLLLNNRRVCHTRTGYAPNFGAEARWFVRSNFKRGLWDQPFNDGSAADLQNLKELGWVDATGRLTDQFLPFVEDPMRLVGLPQKSRELAAKALCYTPVLGSRIV